MDEAVLTDEDNEDISPMKSINPPIREQANSIAESLRQSLAMRESGKDYSL